MKGYKYPLSEPQIMGSSNKAPRHKLEYTSDYPNKKVYPKDCVPMNRPHGSWTNGVKAYERGTSGSSDTWVGWFHPPRLRNKGHKNRYKSNLQKRGLNLPQEEE